MIANAKLSTHALDLAPQLLEFALLALQKVGGQLQLLGDALGGQEVHILKFVGILREVAPLHETLVP